MQKQYETMKKTNGKDLHTSAGLAILVKGNLYYEKDKKGKQSGLNLGCHKGQAGKGIFFEY